VSTKYTGVFKSLKDIYTSEGPLGLFKGLSIALVNVPLFLGFYWYSYENMKKFLKSRYDMPLPVLHIASATSSAFLADCVSNPLWVVRTRLQTEYLHSTLASYPTVNETSAISMVQNIYRQEGIKAFYKGLTASFLGLPHVAIQFPLYEHFKATAKERKMQTDPMCTNPKLSAIDIIVSSIMAKVIAISLTYPHEVIRIRMQDSRAPCMISGETTAAAATASASANVTNHALSIADVIKGILKNEGFAALFAGFQVNLVRVIPATITTFLTYEYVHSFLKDRNDDDDNGGATS
jgi:solute carrier family 25 folate transporter 32